MIKLKLEDPISVIDKKTGKGIEIDYISGIDEDGNKRVVRKVVDSIGER